GPGGGGGGPVARHPPPPAPGLRTAHLPPLAGPRRQLEGLLRARGPVSALGGGHPRDREVDGRDRPHLSSVASRRPLGCPIRCPRPPRRHAAAVAAAADPTRARVGGGTSAGSDPAPRRAQRTRAPPAPR